MPVTHKKTDTIPDWTQADLDAQIALGNFPPGTLLANIVLPSDWNDTHNVSVTTAEITDAGMANGVATLDGSGKVPASQLPSYVDDIIEVANFAALPVTGSTGVLYVTLDNNKVYRWTGSTYVEVSPGDVSSVFGRIGAVTAQAGDYTTAIVADSANKRYVTDANLTVINNTSGTNTGDQTSVTGNAGTATALQTGRTIAITGDLAYTSPTFDGTPNVTAAGTLATVNSNVESFTYSNITVNAKGLITAASSGVAPPTVTPSPLTKADDTNVTLTLGGTPSTALLQSVSITAGWSGVLSVSRGGIGVGTLTGLAKGNGTSAFTAAVAGIDYQAPISLTTTGSGAASFVSNVLNIPTPSGTTSYAETPSGLVNSSNTAYTLANNPASANGVMVFLDGVLQYNGIDYTISGQTITFVTAPVTGSSIFAVYNTASGGIGAPYVDATGSLTMTPNTTYYTNSASLVTLTLPSTFNQNDIFQIIGKGAGGWKVNQATGQTIRLTSTSTTTGTGGSIASTNRYDNLVLRGLIPNTDLTATGRNGTFTVV